MRVVGWVERSLKGLPLLPESVSQLRHNHFPRNAKASLEDSLLR